MHQLARLSNQLARSEQEVLTVTEHRLLLCALRCLHTNDIELVPFAFPVASVVERVDGNAKKLIHEGVRKLRQRLFLDQTLFETLEADDATGTIRGTFNPAQARHLLYNSLKTVGFAQVDLSDTIFTSTHAYRMAWLLASHQGTTWASYSLDQFRRVVLGDASKYRLWNDLQRHVLAVVREQFESNSFNFDYKEDLRKNKVVGITIQVPKLTKGLRGAVVTTGEARTPAAAATVEEPGFEQHLREYAAQKAFPDFVHLYNKLVQKHLLERKVAIYALRWVTEESDYKERVNIINAALRRVAVQALAKKVTNIPQYTLVALKEAKTNYLAAQSEQQERRENRRDNSPAASPVIAALADKFKA